MLVPVVKIQEHFPCVNQKRYPNVSMQRLLTNIPWLGIACDRQTLPIPKNPETLMQPHGNLFGKNNDEEYNATKNYLEDTLLEQV